jgi:ABC-type bacteriocin/lantibiotic exporter with double-glycine peptidase domain
MDMKLKRTIEQSLGLLDNHQKRKILLSILAQIFISVLDLIGIALMGLATSTMINRKFPNSLKSVLKQLGIHLEPSNGSIFKLLVITLVFFCFKSIVTLITLHRITKYLAALSKVKSMKFTEDFYKLPTSQALKNKPEQIAFSFGSAFTIAIVEVIGSFILIVSEFSLILFTLSFLFIVNWSAGLLTLLYFGSVFLGINQFLKKKQRALSEQQMQSRIQALTDIILITNNLREIKVYGLINKFVTKFSETRTVDTSSTQRIFILNQIPKHIFESSFFVGTSFIFAFLVYTQGDQVALVQIILFIAAGSRMMPSMIRLQSCFGTIHAAEGYCSDMFDRLEEIVEFEVMNLRISESDSPTKVNQSEQDALIKIRNLKFSHASAKNWTLSIGEFDLHEGDKVAVIGESGSGKSTFVDILLGLSKGHEGTFSYSNTLLDSSGEVLPGIIGYVPQRVNLFQGSLLDNVTFYDPTPESAMIAMDVLSKVGLADWVQSLPYGIKSEMQNLGENISGGQAQRIGLARALYRNPQILILDEPTSSLDKVTETRLLEELVAILAEKTVLAVTHSSNLYTSFDKRYEFHNGKMRRVE